ncbi:MAG: GH25 family lysozyme [Coprobacillaceae bacterium]
MRKIGISTLLITLICSNMITNSVVSANDDEMDVNESNSVTENSDIDTGSFNGVEPDEVILDGDIEDGVLSNPDAIQSRATVNDIRWGTEDGKKVMYDGYGNKVGYGESKKVIDVSLYNGTIDWPTAKNGGVDGAILRATSYGTGSIREDSKFNENMQACKNINMPFGVYLYSYATNASEALSEANYLISILTRLTSRGVRPSDMTYPVYLDLEGNSYTNGISISTYESIVNIFIGRMEQAGYKTHVYSYKSYLQNNLNSPNIHKYVSWVAQYGPAMTFTNNYYSGLYGWQYRSDGTVPGVSGNVDLNCFSDFYGYDTQNTTGAKTGKAPDEPTLDYRAYSQGVGQLPYFTELNTAGTTGRGLDLYTMNITMLNMPKSAYLTGQVSSNNGWTNYDYIDSNTNIGEKNKSIQFVNFDLKNVAGYKLYYRVHSSEVGWQNWTPQGSSAGTTGSNIQAIEFKLVADSSVIITEPGLYYKSHVAEIGWSDYAPNGMVSGDTTGTWRMEAIRIGIENVSNYNIKSKVCMQNEGWKTFENIEDETDVGSVGKSQEIYALMLELTDLEGYILKYQVYFANEGWSKWATNGETLGTEKGNKITAIRVTLEKSVDVESITLNKNTLTLEKGKSELLEVSYNPESANINTKVTWSSSDTSIVSVDENGKITAHKEGQAKITATSVNGKTATCDIVVINAIPEIHYTTHVQDLGWQGYVKNGQTAGTMASSKRLEALKIKVTNNDYLGDVEYQAHVQDIGWQEWKTNDAIAGTSGQLKRIEALRIRLTDDLAQQYDVYYRVHAEDYGWLGWAKNGESAGTEGLLKRLEAIEIVLVKKGEPAPGETSNAFVKNQIRYQTHIQDIGWQEWKVNSQMSGTQSQSKRLEGIKLVLWDQEYTGNIQYRTHIQDIGWQNWKSNGEMSGTSGQLKRLEATEIKLTGEMSKQYDIYYRVHAEDYGWLGWAKNGESAGTSGMSKRLEAVEVVLVKKGGVAPGTTANAYIKK